MELPSGSRETTEPGRTRAWRLSGAAAASAEGGTEDRPPAGRRERLASCPSRSHCEPKATGTPAGDAEQGAGAGDYGRGAAGTGVRGGSRLGILAGSACLWAGYPPHWPRESLGRPGVMRAASPSLERIVPRAAAASSTLSGRFSPGFRTGASGARSWVWVSSFLQGEVCFSVLPRRRRRPLAFIYAKGG